MKPWHQLTVDEITKELRTDITQGLTPSEVISRNNQYGYNELKEKSRESLVQKFFKQFKDFLVIILLIASVISAVIGEITDSFVIIAIVLLNASLGVFQEAKAEKALEALKKMSAPSSKTMRDGHLILIPSRELVPGDVVVLEAGDYIPADVRIVETANLKVAEASLTGESTSVEKNHFMIEGEAALGDRHNIGFMSTVVTYGRGRGIVIGTGMETEIGKIAEMLQSVEEDSTPLQLKLKEFGKLLGLLGIVICTIVFLVGIYNGYRTTGSLELELVQSMLMISISLAVAAIPEGLPTVVTIVLALGMQKMAKKNAIMKKLHAVETLGSTTVICSDKTGTLTQNEMTVVKAIVGTKAFQVSGSGYNPEGDFTLAANTVDVSLEPDLNLLLKGAALCNDAQLEQAPETQIWTVIGDPTEGALLVAAVKGGWGKENLRSYPRAAEIPFDSVRKMMTTFHEIEHRVSAFTKGAPDALLSCCATIIDDGVRRSMTEQDRITIQQLNQEMGSQALRVLAIAYQDFEQIPGDLSPDSIEREMTFIGLLGMIDPARPEAKEAVQLCISAGIRTIMITGDHPGTAFAIAKELGIASHDGQVLTGQKIHNMSKNELEKAVTNVAVFARVSPEHKVAIVEALRANGEIVAMTGDGVNDAPALKKAHIGIAMGITGTDVTKEAADMVVADDNFATIVTAIEEGRVIFANIKKFIFFLLSCNASEVLVIFLAMLFGWPIPLLPIQLLWINLVTDAFPALALGVEKKEPDIMRRAPRIPNESLLSKNMIIMIGGQSLVMAMTVLAAFKYGLMIDDDLALARTYAFITLILSQIICAYSARSEHYSAFTLGLFSNKYLNAGTGLSFALLLLSIYGPLHAIFKTIQPGIKEILLLMVIAPIPFFATEIFKIVLNQPKKQRSQAPKQ